MKEETNEQALRAKIERSVEETGKLLPAFQIAYKENSVNSFYQFIQDNKLEEAFFENSFDDLLELFNQEEINAYIKIITEHGISYLTEIYGEEIGEKLQKLSNHNKINYFSIWNLATLNHKENLEEQVSIMKQLLDLYDSDDLLIGIHKTGGWINSGNTINEMGLKLTGDASSGVKEKEYDDIIDRLEDNIEICDEPSLLISQIAKGGNYKNYLGERYVDISLIAIPKEELKNRESKIILENIDDVPILNPQFIKGYVTVDAQNDTLKKYVENPKYITKINEQETVHNSDKWLQRFQSWEQESLKQKSLKENLMLVFRRLSPKYRNKQTEQRNETLEENNIKTEEGEYGREL